MEKYYDFSEKFMGSEEWKSKLLGSMLIYPNFASVEEETEILKEIEPYLKRLHYESSHWDDVSEYLILLMFFCCKFFTKCEVKLVLSFFLIHPKAIHNYRETERAKWNQKNTQIINRIRNVAFPPEVPQLKFVHILDLEKVGVIKPHIDSVRVS